MTLPQALLVTCTDAALDQHLLRRLGGDSLQLWRTAGPVIPPYGSDSPTELAIENAVKILGIPEIIVCGHFPSPALKAVLEGRPESVQGHSHYLHFARATRRLVEEKYGLLPTDRLLQAMVEENVFLQMANLQTYPTVLGAMARGNLKLYGCIFDVKRDQLFGHGPRDSYLHRKLGRPRAEQRPKLPCFDPREFYLA